MNYYLYLFIGLICYTGISQPEDTFEKANDAFADDKFPEAVQLYTSLLDEGLVSTELYFNLGNAYFKQNDLANAIFHYEKALQLNPADQEVRENLEIANTQTIDKIENAPESNLNMMVYTTTHLLKVNTWAWVSVTLSLSFGFFMVLYFKSGTTREKRSTFLIAILFLVFGVTSLLFGRFQDQFLEEQSFAIIFEDQVQVRVEPNTRSDVNFQMNKGTKVSTGSTFREFTQIELSDGSKGWVKTLILKKLYH
jgi:tetratricopeptide (TPR) repeat protein